MYGAVCLNGIRGAEFLTVHGRSRSVARGSGINGIRGVLHGLCNRRSLTLSAAVCRCGIYGSAEILTVHGRSRSVTRGSGVDGIRGVLHGLCNRRSLTLSAAVCLNGIYGSAEILTVRGRSRSVTRGSGIDGLCNALTVRGRVHPCVRGIVCKSARRRSCGCAAAEYIFAFGFCRSVIKISERSIHKFAFANAEVVVIIH